LSECRRWRILGPVPGDARGPEGAAKRIERLLRTVDRFQQKHTVFGFPIGVVKKFGDDSGAKHAALLAYYGFFSVFPLLLVFTTVVGYTLANDAALRQRVIDNAIALFPVLGPQLAGSIETIQGSGLGLVVGIVGTLWAGLGITQSAQDAMNAVWNIPRKDRPGYWLRLARGFGSLVLLGAAIVAATGLAGLGTTTTGILGRISPLVGSLLVNLLLLAVMFQALTGIWVPWRKLLPGAAAGAVAWSALQALGVYIIDRQLDRANLVYGVFAIVIVLLSWLYLSAQLLLYAAEINVVLARRLWPRSLLPPPLTEPDKRVLIALAETEERRAGEIVEVRFAPDAPGGDESQRSENQEQKADHFDADRHGGDGARSSGSGG
jgi:YihY family inner membrane protein